MLCNCWHFISIHFKVNVKSTADRFVSRRAGVNHQAMRSKLFSQSDPVDDNEDVFSQDPYNWKMKSYVNLLSSVLERKEAESRILSLTEVQSKSKETHIKLNNKYEDMAKGWSCVPRKKPVIGQTDMIFDLPGYESSMHNDILDWGKWNLLIATLNNKMFMWHPPTNYVVMVYDFKDDEVLVTKWDSNGEYIAVGTVSGHLYFYDPLNNKIVPIHWKCWKNKEETDTSITALAWSTRGDQLACCTNNGCIKILNYRSQSASTRRTHAHILDILAVKYSPDDRFLVTSGVDCMVKLWCLPNIEPFFEIIYANPVRAIAWHPWKACQLALGGSMGIVEGFGDGSLSFWDVSRQKNLFYHLPTTECAIDALAWSSLTGELIVSCWITGNESEENGQSRVLVLSGPGKVTDELIGNSSRTRALLFDPDGTKIATVTSDENLFIWNFLGKPGPLLNMYKRKIKRQQMYHKTHAINEYNNFGVIIR